MRGEGKLINLDEKKRPLKALNIVYPGHEYTLKNLKFAAAVDPDNQDVKHRREREQCEFILKVIREFF